MPANSASPVFKFAFTILSVLILLQAACSPAPSAIDILTVTPEAADPTPKPTLAGTALSAESFAGIWKCCSGYDTAVGETMNL